MRTRILSLCLTVVMAFVMAGCSGTKPAEAGTYRIAIVQQLDHPSLDQIRTAITDRLQVRADELGLAVSYDLYNGQNDASVLAQIGTQVVSKGYDAIIPIATLAAQCMANAASGTGIPVIYAAISDPEKAGLTGLDGVTGTSDALDTDAILDMMLAVSPQISAVGLLYSNSEANSLTAIARAEAYLDAKGIAHIAKTGNTTDEIVAAAGALVGQVQAVFTPTDNVVMAAESAVAQLFIKSSIAHYAGADSFVTAGALATCGVDYTKLGSYTADMALDVLTTGKVPAYHVMEGGIITVNTETAAALGVDTAVFATLGPTVVDVVTGSR